MRFTYRERITLGIALLLVIVAGLHPLTVPFGYRVASLKNEPAVPVPAEISLIRQLKDLFLAGRTLQQLCEHADASGVKPRKGAPKWSRTVVRRILLNRYYAGVTTFGRFRKINGKRIPVPRSQWKIGVGRHEPVWDQKTYDRILAEFERREGLRARGQVYALSGLLRCTRCGNRLYRHGKIDGRFPVYISCNNVSDCLSVRYDDALQWVAEQVVRELKNYKKMPIDPKPDTSEQELAELGQLRQRVQQGFEAGLYTEAEAGARIVSIETDMERVVSRAEREAQRHQHQQALLQFAEQDLEKLHDWILRDDPTIVNRLLTALCEEIRISPLRELTVVFR